MKKMDEAEQKKKMEKFLELFAPTYTKLSDSCTTLIEQGSLEDLLIHGKIITEILNRAISFKRRKEEGDQPPGTA
jgi:hypothetical protein